MRVGAENADRKPDTGKGGFGGRTFQMNYKSMQPSPMCLQPRRGGMSIEKGHRAKGMEAADRRTENGRGIFEGKTVPIYDFILVRPNARKRASAPEGRAVFRNGNSSRTAVREPMPEEVDVTVTDGRERKDRCEL